jgi:murein DD-endopeptidase MepM/ murein hydrolase activator NlpD
MRRRAILGDNRILLRLTLLVLLFTVLVPSSGCLSGVTERYESTPRVSAEETETSGAVSAADGLGKGAQPSTEITDAAAAASALAESYADLVEESRALRSVIEDKGSKRSTKEEILLEWPVEGAPLISSPFGSRVHPVLKKKIDHEGIDFALPTASPVRAAADGVVIYVADMEAHGKTVVIDHGNGLASVYCHLSTALVEEGAKVRRGEVVARSGMTGLATGPHLHFEVRVNGKPQNPREFLPKLQPQSALEASGHDEFAFVTQTPLAFCVVAA